MVCCGARLETVQALWLDSVLTESVDASSPIPLTGWFAITARLAASFGRSQKMVRDHDTDAHDFGVCAHPPTPHPALCGDAGLVVQTQADSPPRSRAGSARRRRG